MSGAGVGRAGAAGRGGLIVTLDGPAGSGKSTTAREVARRLGYRHLDSGALYRAITFALLESDHGPDDWERLSRADVEALGVSIVPAGGGWTLRLGARGLEEELRTDRVTRHVSAVARLPAVRGALLGLQRVAGRAGSLVADGRDMGTVVFPRADVKVFIVAALPERARRRFREVAGREPSRQEVAAEASTISRRDRTDATRDLSPLRRPPDAFDLDTTALDFEEQVSRVVQLVRGHPRFGGTRSRR